MSLKSLMVGAGLAVIVAGCAASTSVKEDSPTELTETASTIKPDLEKTRADSLGCSGQSSLKPRK